MSKMARANILACFLIILQVLLALILSGFYDVITEAFPLLTTTTVLIVINQIISVLIPALLFAFFFCRREGLKINGFLRLSPISGRNIILIVAMSIFIQPLMGVLSLITQFFFSNNVANTTLNMADEMSYIPLVATIALTPAIAEEIALRGAILGAYSAELDERRTILINGLIFGIIHLDGQQLLYAIALGVFFSYIVLRTGSIFAGMIAHFTINGTQATLIYLMSRMAELYEPELESAISGTEAQATYEGLETVASLSMLFSLVLFFIILGVCYMMFFRLLTRFSKLNPQTHTIDETSEIYSVNDEIDCTEKSAAFSEIEKLKSAIGKRKRFSKSFYISFLLLIAIYFAFMAFNGIIQIVFLFGVFAIFLFVLFFLRIRG